MSQWTLFSIKGPDSKLWLDVSNEVIETIYGSDVRPPKTSKIKNIFKLDHNVSHGTVLHNDNWDNIQLNNHTLDPNVGYWINYYEPEPEPEPEPDPNPNLNPKG